MQMEVELYIVWNILKNKKLIRNSLRPARHSVPLCRSINGLWPNKAEQVKG